MNMLMPSQPGTTAAGGTPHPVRESTPSLIAAMLNVAPNASDLIFSPGRLPQVKVDGKLVQLQLKGVEMLTPVDTVELAMDLMGRNPQAAQKLKEEGSCDISY